MALFNNPVSMEIVRENGRLQVLEVIPVYEESQHAFVATDRLRIYEGTPRDEADDAEAEAQRERYLQNIELYGADHPLFLGELEIRGNGLPDWRYHGSKLNENEIWQIVAMLMQLTDDHLEEDVIIDEILNEQEVTPEGLAFVYSYGLRADVVRIEESEGHYFVLINEELAATIEMPDEVWEITEGNIADLALRAEIIQRIDAASR